MRGRFASSLQSLGGSGRLMAFTSARPLFGILNVAPHFRQTSKSNDRV